jgi:hypothetical protein
MGRRPNAALFNSSNAAEDTAEWTDRPEGDQKSPPSKMRWARLTGDFDNAG